MKKTIKDELINFLIDSCKTNEEIKKYCDEFVKKKQHELMLNPKINILKTIKEPSGKYYLNVRLFLPISLNETKDLRGYIGPMDNFPNGTKDKGAHKIGVEVIKGRIKEYLEENK
jgi:hypothetical protein